MNSLRQLFEVLRRFWFGPTAVEPLVLCRIGIGLVMLHAWTTYAWELENVWGAHGMTHHLGPHQLELVHAVPWTVWAILIASAVCVVLGLATPAAAVSLAVCQWIFMEPTRFFTWSWARHIPLVLLWLAISGSGRAYSLDSMIRLRINPNWLPRYEVESVGLRMIQIQITTIYLRAAWGRIESSGWIHGEMMWAAMVNPLFARFNSLDLLPFRPLLMLACWAGQLIEMAAPVLLWVRRTRPYMLGLCILFHAVLHISAGVHWWQLFMLAALLVFVSPALSVRLLRYMRPSPRKQTTPRRPFSSSAPIQHASAPAS